MTKNNVRKKPRWRFEDATNTLCFTTSDVLKGSEIVRVVRDMEGDWQFHDARSCPSQVSEDEVKVVALGEILTLDHSIEELSALQIGWIATRDAIGANWVVEKEHAFPTFAEKGYYLENAAWFAENFDDISLPNDPNLESIVIGGFVKLAFRFADEKSEQLDGQYERMWVHVTEIDQDWMVGILDNDPYLDSHRAIINSEDSVQFHVSQIIEILEDD